MNTQQAAALAAFPLRLRALVGDCSVDQLLRAIELEFVDDPEFRPHLDERHLANDRSKVFMLYPARDTLAFEDVLVVVDRDQRRFSQRFGV